MRVAFCWPVKNEPDLRPLMLAWLAAAQPGFASAAAGGRRSRRAARLPRAWTPGGELALDRYGIPTPATGEFIVPQALLLPINGFDADGYRVGYGSGFFDRTPAALRPAPLAGVGFELSRVASIRHEPHDIRLDAMVSEAGVFR